jgi:hypothetical protein
MARAIVQRNRLDLRKKRFHRLCVIEEAGRDKKQSVLWRCRCRCGNELIVPACNLRNGNTKSCGCFKIDELVKRRRTHGEGQEAGFP